MAATFTVNINEVVFDDTVASWIKECEWNLGASDEFCAKPRSKEIVPWDCARYLDAHLSAAAGIINDHFVDPVNQDVAPIYNQTDYEAEQHAQAHYRTTFNALMSAFREISKRKDPCVEEAADAYLDATQVLFQIKSRIGSELSSDPVDAMEDLYVHASFHVGTGMATVMGGLMFAPIVEGGIAASSSVFFGAFVFLGGGLASMKALENSVGGSIWSVNQRSIYCIDHWCYNAPNFIP